jgi:uncharacterized membrane protein
METLTNPQSRLFGALAYLLFFVSGILLLNLEPYSKDDYVRFHARQSIVFSIAWIALTVIFSVFIGVLPGGLGRLLVGIKHLIDLAFAIVWVLLMYKAYTGERYRVPQLSDWADAIGF